MKPHRSKKINLLLLFTSIILVVIISEIALRCLDPFLNYNSFFLNDPYLLYKTNPVMNYPADGFMEKSIQWDQLNESNLIYALGDSYAFGEVRYVDNYMTLIDSRISSYNIVNLGVIAYNPFLYYRQLKKYSSIKKPKIVLINLYLGNDFTEPKEEVKKTVVLCSSSLKMLPWPFASILRHSSLTRDIYSLFACDNLIRLPALIDSMKDLKEKKKMPIVAGNITEGSYFEYGQYVTLMSAEMSLSLKSNSMAEHYYSSGFNQLDMIIDYCNKENITPLFIIIPARYMIEEDVRELVYHYTNRTAEGYNITEPIEKTISYLNLRGVKYINLYPALLAKSQNGSLYALQDIHWNVKGNKVAGDYLTEKLKEMLS